MKNLHLFLAFHVGNVALNPANVNRVVNFGTGTSFFTVAFRWADPGTDCTEGVVFPNRFRSPLDVAETDTADKLGRVGVCRTGLGAGPLPT